MAEERIKRRRLPSRQACLGCRKRKHRCDGERPQCGGCRSRWVTCQYADTTNLPSPEDSRASSRPDTYSRDGYAEQQRVSVPLNSPLGQRQSVGGLVPQPGAAQRVEAQEGRVTWNASPGSSRIPDDSPLLEERHSYQNSESQARIPGSQQNADLEVSTPSDSGDPDGYFGDSSTFAFVSQVQPESEANNGVHLHTIGHRDISISQNEHSPGDSLSWNPADHDVVYKLPERSLADSLVDGYFDRVHAFYPFVHEPSFRADYEKMWVNTAGSVARPSWYALLNIIFALGCEFCKAIPADKVLTTVRPFVNRSRKIIFSYVFKKGNLELLQALLLMSHYLQGTLQLNECWNLVGLMIRTAFTIGLHLDPEGSPISAAEVEIRKRVWWGCFIIDRTLSMKFGRPSSIQAAEVYDVPCPLAVDDQYIHNDSTTPRQPANRPSEIAFFIHTIELSQVIDNILKDLYATNRKSLRLDAGVSEESRQYQFLSRAVLLDGQLRSWWKDVPAHLRPESEVDGQIFKRQRSVMRVRYLQIRILLQRQLLIMFSRQQIEDHFLRSIVIAGAQTCIYAARETVQIIHSQYHTGLLNSLWYNLHYVFTSMGVLLHVQGMDKSRLELLGIKPEQETLEAGMEFLRAAGPTSHLAARYATILQRVRNEAKLDDAGTQGNSNNNTVEPAIASTNNDLDMSCRAVVPTTAPSAAESIPMQSQGIRNAFGDADLDIMNFDDLLFGIGLPQDVLSFDYTNGGFLL